VAVRALNIGRPQVVSDVGWFSELPDDVAFKVPVGDDEVDVFAARLEQLARDSELRAAMGAAARSYAESEHDLGRVADGYATALEEHSGQEAVNDAVQNAVASAAADVGLEPRGKALGEIAERLREAGRGS
jgi:hypothetical protein